MRSAGERYSVKLTREAERDLRRLRPWTDQANRAVLQLEGDPYRGHALVGSLHGTRSLEFTLKGGGAYRAVYVVLAEELTCLDFVGPHENIDARAVGEWPRRDGQERS